MWRAIFPRQVLGSIPCSSLILTIPPPLPLPIKQWNYHLERGGEGVGWRGGAGGWGRGLIALFRAWGNESIFKSDIPAYIFYRPLDRNA